MYAYSIKIQKVNVNLGESIWLPKVFITLLMKIYGIVSNLLVTSEIYQISNFIGTMNTKPHKLGKNGSLSNLISE